MACVPLTSNKRKFSFEATVNLDSLMAVPYVNAVFFTKMRLLNSRNNRQYSERVSVVDNSVYWNSSHTFLCKVHINPDTNVLESCKLKISVRMSSPIAPKQSLYSKESKIASWTLYLGFIIENHLENAVMTT
ncbi:hypothetical protein ACTXT7_008848 [Hymenolepis weldensis]